LLRLEIMLISTQYWCTVCVEHATGLEIVLGAPDGTPRYVGLVEARFNLFGDSVNDNLNSDRCVVCIERAIGSEIIMGAPDGTR
jgi:hypothetical protein